MTALNSLTNNRLLNKHSEKIAWVVALAFLVLMVLWVIWSAWNLREIKQANYQPQNISPINVSSVTTYSVNDIVSANLFGDPSPVSVVKVAPKTTLDLTLEGVLWSSDNSVGRAIITSGNKKSDLYSVGEDIEGSGAKIEEIRDGEVILNRNGALESLPLIKMIDSSNRIIVSYPNESTDNAELKTQVTKSSVPNSRESITNRRASVQERTSNTNQTRRVRRPNFSGLDRALEKMGEL